jgi:endonuclease/exonuclease/phosphatase family metal-dependent hydrolase
MSKSPTRHRSLGLAILLAWLLPPSIALAQRATVKVMTYNLFQGTDFVEILSAQTFPEYLTAANLTLNQVIDSNPPLRMKAIAHQIAITQPDLVGLQEATLWRLGVGKDPTDVLYDPLEELLSALDAQGEHYYAVQVIDEYELQGPLDPGFSIWLKANGRNVMLARSEPGLQLSGVQSGNFDNLLTLPTILGPLTIYRGWGSADVQLHGQNFRFIITHLENPIPQIPATFLLQQAQAMELNYGPANTSLPVILAGDFNAIANDLTDPSNATYQEMLNFGFGDAWADRNPPRSGLTWPLMNSSAVATATQRIDFVFYRGILNARETRLAGDSKQDQIEGMWPSDHAGLRALLQIGAQRGD